jgi:hypothetical protein
MKSRDLPRLFPIIFAAALLPACSSVEGQVDGGASDGGSADGGSIQAPVQADCSPNTAPFPIRPEPVAPATLPFLHVEGRRVLDENGNPVALRGVNFGSWLMMETWISGIGVKSERELMDEIFTRAEALGLGDLLADAKAQNIIECSLYTKAHWICVKEWRDYSYANARKPQKAQLDQLWGWFDSEPWIFEERSLWNWLQKRFGYAGMLELKRAFQDSYITEKDVELVAAAGLNLIRLPVWYQALETDQEGENAFNPEGWRRLDDILTWARRHKVYIMLDLHGAPGGQSPWWHQGLENGGFFWKTQACIDKTARLWKALAAYFKDEPHIAVYDLLNEPNSAPDKAAYTSVYQSLYGAVRESDSRHIVMTEDGFLTLQNISGPAEMGWTNAIASFHDYPGGSDAASHEAAMENGIKKLADIWDRFDCPLFYGEFNVYGPNDFSATDKTTPRWQPDAMDRVLSMMNSRGVHWAPWSWKYFASPSMWGVYHPAKNAGGRIDVRDAGFEEIKAAFTGLHTDNFALDQEYGALLEKNAKASFGNLDLK